MEELEKEALVLQGDVLDTEATFLLAPADFIPHDETSGSSALIFSDPKKSSTALVQGLNDPLREKGRSHEVGGEPIQHRVEEDEAATKREKGCLPASKASVSFGDERCEGGEIDLDVAI